MAGTQTKSQPPAGPAAIDCAICGGRGLEIIEGADGEPAARTCRCVALRKVERMIAQAGLTDEQRAVRLADFMPGPKTAPMLEMVQDYLAAFDGFGKADGSAKGFGLTGPVGIGKSMLAQAVTNELLDRRVPVVYIDTPDLMYELKDAQFEHAGHGMEEKIRFLKTVDMVIFDDLARERVTDWVQDQYFRIINGRYVAQLPTCFTSNHNLRAIGGRLGGATASRLYAMTRGRLVDVVDAPDYRIVGPEYEERRYGK